MLPNKLNLLPLQIEETNVKTRYFNIEKNSK